MNRPSTTSLPTAPGPRKFLIHGNPGSGKTPLSLSLPWGPVWGEKAVLVSCDKKELNLPCEASRYIHANYTEAKDPFTCIKDVLTYDWREEGAGTIIIDTATALANDYLAAALNAGGYNSKVVTFGTNTIKLTDKPHYGLAHNLMRMTVELIKKCPLNVIAVFLSGYDEPGEGGVGAFGGPMTINMNEARKIAGEFSNIIYCRTINDGGKTQYLAHTENCGIWCARLNGVQPNPIPQIKMEIDPVNVWKAIDAAQKIGYTSHSQPISSTT